jgi:outer membrane protein assembly factor BamB
VKRTRGILFAVGLALLASAHASGTGEDWYQWRGPNRDGISPDKGLLKQWPAGGPPLAWKATGLGTGYSSVSICGDRIFTMGDVGDRCKLLALGLADGKILWTADVGKPGGNRGAGPRSTPATDGTLVFALGQHGELLCAEAATGKEVWRKSFVSDFGGKAPGWFYSESPLLDGNTVVCTPGGSRGAVVALEKASGKTVWQSQEFKDGAQYASLVPTDLGGVRQYVVFTMESVAGIAAKDGKLLWRADRQGKTAICATPILREGLIFVSSAYNVGCNAFQVTAANGQFKAEEVYSGKQMMNHHGGMILVGDHAYGLGDGHLKCLEIKTGKVVWQDRCVGKGSIAYADGRLICRGEGGGMAKAGANAKPSEVALVEASPAGYKELGRFSLERVGGDGAWAHPVVFGGKLYIRDWDDLFCYDVKAK